MDGSDSTIIHFGGTLAPSGEPVNRFNLAPLSRRLAAVCSGFMEALRRASWEKPEVIEGALIKIVENRIGDNIGVTVRDMTLKEQGGAPREHAWLATAAMMYDAFANNDVNNTWMPEWKNKIWVQYAAKFAAVMELDRDVGHITTNLRHDENKHEEDDEDRHDQPQP